MVRKTLARNVHQTVEALTSASQREVQDTSSFTGKDTLVVVGMYLHARDRKIVIRTKYYCIYWYELLFSDPCTNKYNIVFGTIIIIVV